MLDEPSSVYIQDEFMQKKNPKLHPITLRLKLEDIETFKEEAERAGIAYQTLIRGAVRKAAEEIRAEHPKNKSKKVH